MKEPFDPGLDLTPAQRDAFQLYTDLLLTWNRHFNLTAVPPEALWSRHFLDSLTCLQVMHGKPVQRVIDIGTGAGFPGLVLKIARPEMQLTLVEAIGKKTAFCAEVVRVLGLENVEIQTARAETLGQNSQYREQYDWAVARAVAPLPVLAEYLLPFVKIGGWMLAQKGKDADEEAHHAKNAFTILGGELSQVVPVMVPKAEGRALIVVAKTRPTPERYPRRSGIPAKRPL